MKKTATALTTAALLALAAPAQAEVYGLVIGVDKYEYVGNLDGAVNDARDIAGSLKRLGAKEVRLLTNKEASRDAILKAWGDLTAKAKDGDTIVWSFAGHGAQSPERIKGSETDGMDEFLVLSGFNFEGAATRERLVDDDIGEMLSSVPRLNVLFVADACNSGTMTRAYSKPKSFKTRNIVGPPIKDDALPLPKRAIEPDADRLSHVVSFSAVPDGELDPEIIIDGQSRGALSFAIARGLDGMADLNKDGLVKKDELEPFVREVVRMAVDGQQHPQIAPKGKRELAIPVNVQAAAAAATPKTEVKQAAATPAPKAEPAEPAPENLRFAIVNGGAAAPGLLKQMQRVVPVAQGQQADLTWDVSRGEITNQLGDVVSYGGDTDTRAFKRVTANDAAAADPQADLPRVQGVVDKMVLVNLLKDIAMGHGVAMSLQPNDKLHRQGEHLAFAIEGQKLPYMTLFNLGSDGTVNFLYPQANDPQQVPLDRPYKLELSVEPPFGADHLVAILTDKPATEFHKRLAALDGKPSAVALADALNSLNTLDAQVGIHAAFTAPK